MIPIVLPIVAVPQRNVLEVQATPADPVVMPFDGALTEAWWTGKDRDGVDTYKIVMTAPDGASVTVAGVRMDDPRMGLLTDQRPTDAPSRWRLLSKSARIGQVASVPTLLVYAQNPDGTKIPFRDAVPEAQFTFLNGKQEQAPAPQPQVAASTSQHMDLATPLIIGLILAMASDGTKGSRRGRRRA